MRLPVKKAALVTSAAVALVAGTVPPAEAAVPYRNWVQASHNKAGVIFYPEGDSFRIWNNMRSDGPETLPIVAHAEWNYVGVKDKWHSIGNVFEQSNAVYSRNLSEKRQIYFRVCYFAPRQECSSTVRFRVGGRNP
ncbi:hypothetical protein [Actinomadura macrotermitis]|uniref:Uncharacterized protein n=1 Tax=Actinomadura macrotermitis TaxID=2585200 RepID=A0A7K0C0D7_9ACTN|nr:hypothetical protein [Actinomadura macrotermitis]MQY06928.1 hypothetical protein [Actinomadura macrotermitis]